MKLTIEQRRNIFLAAYRIEEASILASRRSEGGASRPFYEDKMSWKDWQIDFYGCIPDDSLQVLIAHYMRPISETRNPKGKQLIQTIRSLWRLARKRKILGYGLHISESLNI